MRTFATKPFLLVAILLSLGTSVFAAKSVEAYKEDLQFVRDNIAWLIENPDQSDSGKELTLAEREVFDEIRDYIPASEEVTAGNDTIQTSNEWISQSIKSAESEKDLEKRLQILIELDERLAAISVKIDDLLAAQASARSKDDDKQKLSEILKRAEYKRPEPKEKSESALAKLLARFMEWLASWFPSMEPSTGPSFNAGGAASVLYYVVIALIIALAAFLLYKLVPLFVPSFKRKVKDEKKERVILGEKIDENISSSDLFAAADELARKGDLRGAIRKGYVAFLCELSDRHLIGLARHKTNRDYLRDVRPRTDIYKEMNGLTGSFERHWYGDQTADNEDWNEFRRRCGDTIKAL